MRRILLTAAFIVTCLSVPAQMTMPADSDHDGLSDTTENALLKQFAPRFMASAHDCSARPARFVPFERTPKVQAEDGTIYGQAFPRSNHADQVELHFYHLWRTDCGDMGHSLDAEHVSALLTRDEDGKWKALYWYAAAHEDTICDASQIAGAASLAAELSGPRVWISNGKHGSFFSNLICRRGCGSDDCRDLEALAVPAIVNLGEPSAPVAGAEWVESAKWPLENKMNRSDFSEERMARAVQQSDAVIVWAQPQKRPYQAAIHGGNNTVGGLATGARATDVALAKTDKALDVTDAKTANALAGASRSTGRSLSKSYRGVKNALGTSTRKVGKALGAGSGEK